MRSKLLRISMSLVLAAATAVSGGARAASVDVNGGFTDYWGPLWNHDYGGFVVTTPFSADGGPPLTPSATQTLPGNPDDIFTSAGIGLGGQSFTNGGGPAHAVEFWLDFGSKDAVNGVSFTPGPTVNVTVGNEFLLGTFTFTNGGWFGTLPFSGGTYTYPESAFSFQITTSSADSALNGHTFAGTLRLHVTGTTSLDPADDADYFYFEERPDLGYVGAFEAYNTPPGQTNTGSIELYGRIGSLVPTRFANAQGVVLASAIPLAPVPEPQTWLMLACGMAVLARQIRCRQSACFTRRMNLGRCRCTEPL